MPVLTTADLQLAEACALVETLPKWKVVKKVTFRFFFFFSK